MKPSALIRLSATACCAIGSLVFLPACNTTPDLPNTAQAQRIIEHKADYETLPKTAQAQLAKGLIARGQSMKLVYVALGRPNRIVTTPDGKTITWTYRNYVPPITDVRKFAPKEERLSHVEGNHPLNDVFEGWRNNLQKHEIILPLTESEYNTSAVGNRAARPMEAVPRAPGQSWSDYAAYRRTNSSVRATGSQSLMDATRAKAQSDHAEHAKEAAVLGPISGPQPITLDVTFIDGVVSDAIVDDWISAFELN